MARNPNISTSPTVEAVLRAAMVKGPIADLDELALKKCTVKGWIQFEGDAGENVALTATGRKACEQLGYIAS